MAVVIFSENLAKTAQIADKITVVRSLTGRIPDHAQATYQMFTGYLPSAAIMHPSIGAVVANQFGTRNDLPAYVGVPHVPEQAGSGYLSSKFGAFELGGDLSRKDFKVRDMALPKGMTEDRMAMRRSARQAVEDHFRQAESNPGELDAMDDFYAQAYKLISSDQARRAFSFRWRERRDRSRIVRRSQRPPRDRNVNSPLARRLVEAGVRSEIAVVYGGSNGWDNHIGIKDAVNNGMLGCSIRPSPD